MFLCQTVVERFLPSFLRMLEILRRLWFGICWSKMVIIIFLLVLVQEGLKWQLADGFRGGIPLFRHNKMWLRVTALRWLPHASAGHVSCCSSLICFHLSALFPWFYLLSPTSWLVPVCNCGQAARRGVSGLCPQSSAHLKLSSRLILVDLRLTDSIQSSR